MTTPHWIEELLACPSCGGELLLSSGAYTCRDCTRAYPIRYGIPDFRLEPDPYISYADEIRKIEGFATTGESFAAMVRAYYVLTPESPPNLHRRYIASMDAAVARGAGMIAKLRARCIAPPPGSGTALDLGCGTAGMSIAASREFSCVVGVDVALRWLVMGKRRLFEEGIEIPLICANAEALPFKRGLFDVVVADAVIEHVRNPGRMRDETLRVLKPGGGFFFTTNNRYSVLPEPHLRVFGFGVLPRRWMEAAAMRLRQTPYKVHLHSRRELVDLFRGHAEVILPFFFEGELGSRHEKTRRRWERLRRSAAFRMIFGRVVPQYFVIGQRPADPPPTRTRGAAC